MSLPRETTTFPVELDDDITALLIEMAEACHAEPQQIAAALLTDVLRDDAVAHGQIHAGVDRTMLQ